MDINGVVGDIIGIVGPISFIVTSIYVLAVFGNAIALGGTQALDIIYQGISALVLILGILGIGHFYRIGAAKLGFRS
ncbi:MAG: hypothetical protein RXP92_01695 [Candidatus Micrarchaeota archaeon]